MTSVPITVVPNPLRIGYHADAIVPAGLTLGMHQELPDSELVSVYQGRNLLQPEIGVRSTDSAIVRPGVSTIRVSAASDGTAFFNLIAGDRTGTAWIAVSAAGMTPDSIEVTVGQPGLQFYRVPSQDPSEVDIAVRLVDQAGRPRITPAPVTLNLWSTDAAVLGVDSATMTVPAMGGTTGKTRLHFVGPGTAAIRVSNPRNVPYASLPAATRLIEVDSLHHPLTQILPDVIPVPPVRR